jgi:hypothetical protein
MDLDSLASMLTPLTITPEALDMLYSVGHQFITEDAPRSALPVFRLMLACAPTDERAWLGLGLCHELLDQEDIALEIFGSGTVAANPAPRCHLARARILGAQGRSADAREAHDAARAIADDRNDDDLAALIANEGRTLCA